MLDVHEVRHLFLFKDNIMQVRKLHRILTQLIEEGHGRKPICPDKSTFEHNLESDGCTVLHIDDVKINWIPLIDDDGGIAHTKTGIERGKVIVVLLGDGDCDHYSRLKSRS